MVYLLVLPGTCCHWETYSLFFFVPVKSRFIDFPVNGGALGEAYVAVQMSWSYEFMGLTRKMCGGNCNRLYSSSSLSSTQPNDWIMNLQQRKIRRYYLAFVLREAGWLNVILLNRNQMVDNSIQEHHVDFFGIGLNLADECNWWDGYLIAWLWSEIWDCALNWNCGWLSGFNWTEVDYNFEVEIFCCMNFC